MSTGLTKPVSNTATVDLNSEVWAVFEDEVSDEGFEYDDPRPDIEEDHRRSPLFDRDAAADALRNVGRKDVYTFEPPRPAFADAPNHKARGWSSGSRSVRTSSSSSNNRSALTGLLETMGMMGISSGSSNRAGSGRVSRTSDRSEEMRARELSTQPQTEDQSKWSVWLVQFEAFLTNTNRAAVLLANETIIFTSSVSVRPPTSIPIPSFLMPAPRRRQLILTDFPRLILVKDDDPALLKVKSECIFAIRPKGSSSGSGNMQVGGNVANRVVDLQEKGTKGFIVQIVSDP